MAFLLLFCSGFLCLVLSPSVFGAAPTCDSALGLGTGAVETSQLSAGKLPEGASLDDVRYDCCKDKEEGGLCVDPPDQASRPYLDIRFSDFTAISAITLQAPFNKSSYVRWYRVKYVPYKETGLKEVMDGGEAKDFRAINTAVVDEFKSDVSPRIITRHLRLVFDDFSNRACLRLELFGCQSSALCTTACQNGGVCVGIDECECAAGFSGPSCERAKLVINPEVCNDPMGMASGDITSSQLSAKTTAKNSSIEFARADCCRNRRDGAWCPDPDTKSVGQWLQVEFPKPMGITKIRIQKPIGPTGPEKYVKTYSVKYIPEAEKQAGGDGEMDDYTKDGKKVIFKALDKTISSMTSELDVPIYTRALRLVVESYEGQPCLRFELFGCDPEVVEEESKNIELTTKLKTAHFVFVLMGTPVPQFVHGIGNESQVALDLFEDQFVLIKARRESVGRPCPLDLAACEEGITIHLSLSLKVVYDNTFIFSNGGYSPGTNGLTILYRFESLHVYVQIAEKFWFVSYRPDRAELLGVNSDLYVTWHVNRGLKFYFNHVLVVESATFQRVMTKVQVVKSDCFIGGLPALNSPFMIALLYEFRIWTVHMSVLIEKKEVVVEDKIKPGTCPAGCVEEGSSIEGFPIMEGSPVLTVRIDKTTGVFEFVCTLPSVAEKNVEYHVKWLSAGRVVASSILKADRKVAILQLTGATLKSAVKSTMMCTVRSRFTGGCGGQLGVEKRSFYFTARIELITTTLVIVEGGGRGKVEILTNTPPSMLCPSGHFTISVQLEVKKRELRDRCGRVISQAVVARLEGQTTSDLNVTEDNWTDVHAFFIKAVLDLRRDGDQQRGLTVFVTCGAGLKIVVGVVKVTIRDADKKGSCAWWNDPHVRTFNGIGYDNFYAGEFVYYRNKKLPYQINTIQAQCAPRSRATCNCAVAIQSGDDVIIFDKCMRQKGERQDKIPLYIYFMMNGPLTKGTELRRLGSGHQHVLTLPHGGEVSVSISQHFLNIEYKPGPTDYEQTEGLCGTFDNSRANDLTMRNGAILTKYGGSLPNPFNADWRAREGEELFAGAQPVVDEEVIHEHYCRVLKGEKEECGPGYDRYESASTAKGQIVTNMYTRDFSYDASLGLRRRKRSTDNNGGFDPFAPFDMDISHDPGNSSWPTESGRTEKFARDYCTNTIEGDPGVQQCTKFLDRPFTAEIEACVKDIGATDELRWTQETVAAIVRECRTELDSQDNAAEEGQLPAPLAGGLTVEELENSLCPKNCTGNGDCTEGVCVCDKGFIGDDCSRKLSDPPQVNYVHDNGLCDLNDKKCADAVIFGDNFYDTSTLTCHMQPYQLGSPLPSLDSEVIKVPATYTKFDQIACPVADKRPYLLRVSNDAERPTAERLLFMTYDSVCELCVVDGVDGDIEKAKCTRVPNTCIIDGGCYAKGATNPDQTCEVCEPEASDTKWSSSFVGECHNLSRALSTTDIVIIVLVTVIVLAVLIFTIAYICYRKCTVPVDEYDGPPVIHKSTRYFKNPGSNDAFVEDFDSHDL